MAVVKSKVNNMGKMIVKEFKNQSNIELIESLMNSNNGYITSKMVTDLGIHRMYLNIMKEKGIIERVGRDSFRFK